jgi:hypothetical protein
MLMQTLFQMVVCGRQKKSRREGRHIELINNVTANAQGVGKIEQRAASSSRCIDTAIQHMRQAVAHI